ncbi:MAG TPA: dUTP diphosphatase [Smithellaceae bacterium]|jgi:dUTP pyrophosphatase|nr:dUTP diphosphatase [Syntrophaceae bacterium]HNV56023.1 dUTP diphosphatase [Smithellaceae bacterium]MBP8666593.1 dUTP diphosphatase [Syntrophaceae bacterium]MBP9531181.1 dUTP diphosphatase [Syntrophaceae bacterium]MBP9649782.1 dUTP diphosphatase [Syntrophaceae bacterium]
METINVQIRKIAGNEDLPLPEYMTRLAAGMDLFAAVAAEETILPGARKKIPTGIVISLPEGYEAQIRPRSGLALHQGLTLLNSPGTIDADYRGEIALIVINHGDAPFVVKRGARLAQMVVQKICRVQWVEALQLDETPRGEGGFGHT